jgi:hypothetical protein
MNIKNVLFSMLMLTCVSSPIFAGGMPSHQDGEVEKVVSAVVFGSAGLGAGAYKGAAVGLVAAGPLGAVACGAIGAGLGALGGATAGYFGFVVYSAVSKELKRRN